MQSIPNITPRATTITARLSHAVNVAASAVMANPLISAGILLLAITLAALIIYTRTIKEKITKFHIDLETHQEELRREKLLNNKRARVNAESLQNDLSSLKRSTAQQADYATIATKDRENLLKAITELAKSTDASANHQAEALDKIMQKSDALFMQNVTRAENQAAPASKPEDLVTALGTSHTAVVQFTNDDLNQTINMPSTGNALSQHVLSRHLALMGTPLFTQRGSGTFPDEYKRRFTHMPKISTNGLNEAGFSVQITPRFEKRPEGLPKGLSVAVDNEHLVFAASMKDFNSINQTLNNLAKCLNLDFDFLYQEYKTHTCHSPDYSANDVPENHQEAGIPLKELNPDEPFEVLNITLNPKIYPKETIDTTIAHLELTTRQIIAAQGCISALVSPILTVGMEQEDLTSNLQRIMQICAQLETLAPSTTDSAALASHYDEINQLIALIDQTFAECSNPDFREKATNFSREGRNMMQGIRTGQRAYMPVALDLLTAAKMKIVDKIKTLPAVAPEQPAAAHAAHG